MKPQKPFKMIKWNKRTMLKRDKLNLILIVVSLLLLDLKHSISKDACNLLKDVEKNNSNLLLLRLLLQELVWV